ncbi:hypothetical protein SEA_NYCEIRAE_42 [Gordonia phage Nyceirae]|uniref:Uncharacterized protein n=1 Tax=Gordonia phage Nyceirae TaxID=1887651 RepID=A0A1C9EI31_9CAUD|nr:hypothetical protein BIZ68_gp42 [Gordonia phage Nyceirae]AON97405.1 hypothetical protein SEA_NYCEIRAE_42 [Gordonia phage Nyceirae]
MNTTIHPEPSALAGRAVVVLAKSIATEVPQPMVFMVEDYWDRVSGGSWQTSVDSPDALAYGLRAGFADLPLDDEVLYGSIGSTTNLIHVSEVMTADEQRQLRAESRLARRLKREQAAAQ